MSIQEPDNPESSGRGDEPLPVPDEVWRRFLADSEEAIRKSAPKEPSARERLAPDRWEQSRLLADEGDQPGPEAVGELWQPHGIPAGPAWRDLDGPGKRRRAGRVLGTVVAAIVALWAASQLPTGSGTPVDRDGDTTSTQSEDTPGAVPTATARPPAPAAEDPDPAAEAHPGR